MIVLNSKQNTNNRSQQYCEKVITDSYRYIILKFWLCNLKPTVQMQATADQIRCKNRADQNRAARLCSSDMQ